jgi:hypothetical protein
LFIVIEFVNRKVKKSKNKLEKLSNKWLINQTTFLFFTQIIFQLKLLFFFPLLLNVHLFVYNELMIINIWIRMLFRFIKKKTHPRTPKKKAKKKIKRNKKLWKLNSLFFKGIDWKKLSWAFYSQIFFFQIRRRKVLNQFTFILYHMKASFCVICFAFKKSNFGIFSYEKLDKSLFK